jgi:hypothetical protein
VRNRQWSQPANGPTHPRPQRVDQVKSREESPEGTGSFAYSPDNRYQWYNLSLLCLLQHSFIYSPDVFSSGVVVTTVSALIAVICTLTIIHIVFFPASSRIDRIHGIMLAFCAVWLFVTMIPFTAFVANRSADVTATLNGVALPSSLIDRAERTLGVTRVYKDISYCTVFWSFEYQSGFLIVFFPLVRLVAILPWFTVLFTAIAAGVLFTASSRATATTETHIEEAPKSPTDSDTHATIEKE